MMERDLLQRKLVPWYSKAEWNSVFENIYSNDIALQEEAYERMCIWKMRCPKLPVGVECTMEVLQISLWNKKSNEVLHSEKDLQLMYSTTIIRFVNQITHLINNKLNKNLSYYEVANMYKIPDWIINIRHQAAHKSDLPCLELLKLANNYALEWLYKNYWLVEADRSEDLILNCSDKTIVREKKIKIFFNLWQSCKLYKFANYHTLGEIPNAQLRSHLHSLRGAENVLNLVDDISNSVTLETYLINDKSCEKSSIKIIEFLKFLIKYLKELLMVDSRNNDTNSIFIKSLIQCELFLPITYNHTFYSNGENIHNSLSNVWREVLEIYHDAQLISDLLVELAEISLTDDMHSRQFVASCWLSYITESLLQPSFKVPVNRDLKENEKFAVAFIKKDEQYEEAFERLNQHSLLNLNLAKSISLNNHVLENIVRRATMNPNQYTILYLPSLLNLMDPPLDPSSKTSIIELVKAYTSTEDCKSTSDTVYTADMLPYSNMSVSLESLVEECEIEDFQVKSIWSKKYGVYDWSSCPLGRLPHGSDSYRS